jgi:hypothetical protein
MALSTNSSRVKNDRQALSLYQKILLALAMDHGHGSRAIEIARRLRAEDGKIIAVYVFDKIPSFASYYMPPDKKTVS